ncbi:hypothetical protein [Halalkalibacter sp. APA_J-10(15)]|uniref:hypothetical protein n=1 Tax=Halalkalibacter sp. APA_J-10(15) TaxID=2933805 RepID=UPI001FF3EA31|nr:hypothetical protein [Halalkalibacter sp. APA_J-10(15)]
MKQKIHSYMLYSLVIYLVLYILWLPDDHSPVNKQLIGLGIIISFIVGAIGYFTFYIKQVQKKKSEAIRY